MRNEIGQGKILAQHKKKGRYPLISVPPIKSLLQTATPPNHTIIYVRTYIMYLPLPHHWIEHANFQSSHTTYYAITTSAELLRISLNLNLCHLHESLLCSMHCSPRRKHNFHLLPSPFSSCSYSLGYG